MRQTLLFAALLVVGLVRPAAAYSVRMHQRITAEAIALAEKCMATTDKPWHPSAAEKKLITSCNVAQDALPRKLDLWHFYSDHGPLEPIKGVPTPGDTTINRWYAMLVKDLLAQQTFAERLSYMGALMHYVQDMGVPAHVVPIFHPSKKTGVSDNFDDFDKLGKPPPFSEARCAQVLRGVDNPERYFEEVAGSTLQALNDELPRINYSPKTEEPKTFMLLWRPNPAGFGEYGCGGDLFGKVETKCDGEKVELEGAMQSWFATQRYNSVVEATARLIYWARLGTDQQKGKLPTTCPVPMKKNGAIEKGSARGR